jgi:hypothetical protein
MPAAKHKQTTKTAADRSAAASEGTADAAKPQSTALAADVEMGWGAKARARLFGAPATALRCDRLAGVPRRLQKPTRSWAQLTLATVPMDMDQEEESESSGEEEEGEGEGDVEVGMPISPSSSSVLSSVSVSDAGEEDNGGESKAEAAAADSVVVVAPAAASKEEGQSSGDNAAASCWQRVVQALRPRKLKEKLLSFCVGIVHGVAGVSFFLGVAVF